MSGRYVKPYSDKTHFSVPDDAAQDYTDDPHQRNGNGIYNDYTVDLQPKEYTSTFKIACFRFTNTRRTKCMLFGGILAFCVFLIIVVAIASGSRKTAQPETKQSIKTLGLIAYGPDGSGRIEFNPSVSTTYMPYVNRIEHGMADFSTTHQFGNHDKYIKCNENTTDIPEGKVCQYTAMKFGSRCQNTNLYGAIHGRPCVLLVLKLPEGVKPIPLNFSGDQNIDVKEKIHERASPTDVSVSCEGKTRADKDHIPIDKHLGPVIDYHPVNGFPVYSFLASNHEGYVWPGVMVQFNTMTTNHDVAVRCTVLAENLKNEMYSVEFTFNLD